MIPIIADIVLVILTIFIAFYTYKIAQMPHIHIVVDDGDKVEDRFL